MQKKRAKDDKKPKKSKVYTIYNEVQEMLNFSMYPNIVKPQGEMLSDDYNMYVVGLDMKSTRP